MRARWKRLVELSVFHRRPEVGRERQPLGRRYMLRGPARLRRRLQVRCAGWVVFFENSLPPLHFSPALRVRLQRPAAFGGAPTWPSATPGALGPLRGWASAFRHSPGGLGSTPSKLCLARSLRLRQNALAHPLRVWERGLRPRRSFRPPGPGVLARVRKIGGSPTRARPWTGATPPLQRFRADQSPYGLRARRRGPLNRLPNPPVFACIDAMLRSQRWPSTADSGFRGTRLAIPVTHHRLRMGLCDASRILLGRDGLPDHQRGFSFVDVTVSLPVRVASGPTTAPSPWAPSRRSNLPPLPVTACRSLSFPIHCPTNAAPPGALVGV